MRLYRAIFAFVQHENIFLKMLYKVVQSQKEKNKMLYKLVAHRFFVAGVKSCLSFIFLVVLE